MLRHILDASEEPLRFARFSIIATGIALPGFSGLVENLRLRYSPEDPYDDFMYVSHVYTARDDRHHEHFLGELHYGTREDPRILRWEGLEGVEIATNIPPYWLENGLVPEQ